jgi:hypothetical protein
MPAILQIDQAGLPAGTPGVARSDGLDDGSLVTLTSTGGGSTHEARLLWVPPDDIAAAPSFVQATPTTWTFSPTARVYGGYRIELIVDEGLPSEDREIRIFGIRLHGSGALIPALNEIADPAASLVLAGAAQIAASENNEAFLGLQYTGWWEIFRTLALELERGRAGTYYGFSDDFIALTARWTVITAAGGVGAIVQGDDAVAGAGDAVGVFRARVLAGGDSVTLDDAFPFAPTGDVQIEIRVRTPSTLGDVTWHVGVNDGAGASYAWIGIVGGVWQAEANSVTGGGPADVDATAVAGDVNTWHMIRIEIDDGTAARFYLDGVLISTLVAAGAIPRAGDRIGIWVDAAHAAVAGGDLNVDYCDIAGRAVR